MQLISCFVLRLGIINVTSSQCRRRRREATLWTLGVHTKRNSLRSCCGGNTLHVCSGAPRFESLTRHQLLGLFFSFPVPPGSTKTLPGLDHDRLLPDPYQVIHHSWSSMLLYSLKYCEGRKISHKKGPYYEPIPYRRGPNDSFVLCLEQAREGTICKD